MDNDSVIVSSLLSGDSGAPASGDEETLRCLVARKRRAHKAAAIADDPLAAATAPLSVDSLSCVSATVTKRSRRGGDDAAAADAKTIVVVPPYEYCSVAMLNQLRQGNDALDKVLTDKGGTIKNILQSSKSFLHYLVTYPLKNTFRGYIQVSPYLAPRHIALPFRHAVRLFSLDVERDRRYLRFRDDDRGGELWPDPLCAFYFETTRNFGLVLKRDPCIHNGSVVAIERVYVYERSVEYNESIHISPFVLKHLNADFDGDAVTVMILRGIESTRESTRCFADPFLFGSAIPRFTFCQSMVFWIFRALAFDDARDETLACDDSIDPVRASDLLHARLDVRRSERARARALAVFGHPWYDRYVEVLLNNVWRKTVAASSTSDDDGLLPVWRQRPVLDMVYASAVRRHGADAGMAFIDRMRHLLYRRAHECDDRLIVLTDGGRNVYCLENWLLVHSGAKGTPRDLVSLHERTRASLDDAPQADFFRECSVEREEAYLRYLDDFVVQSKHVPKSSYFASGLKWVTQRCVVKQGDLYMLDRLLLRDVAHYMRDLK